MKKTSILSAAVLAASLLISTHSVRAGHLYGGLIDTNGTAGLQAGDALSFVNSSTGAAVTSLALTGTSLVTIGGDPQYGLYRNSGPSFTALSATGLGYEGSAYIAANPFAADAGSFLYVTLASITGPAGANFSFWDTNISTSSPVWTYTIGIGFTLGDGRFDLTDANLLIGDGVTVPPTSTTPNASSPAQDPYGHIHGRSFTMDQLGTYTASYILKDAAGIHPDSAPISLSYSAVPEPRTTTLFAIAGVAAVLLLRRRSRRATR